MSTTTEQSGELTRLEILRAYKKHMVRAEDINVTPFTEDRVIRYQADVQACDVPDIHQEVRELLKESLRKVRAGQPSQVVILAGNPGMGKSHLINYFRSPKLGDELGYVLVGNANHWKPSEFEERLLDWLLDPLVRPSPSEPHLLLDKIQDLAFQSLSQILSQPGQIKRFKRGRGAVGIVRRLWSNLFGNDHVRFQQMVERRDENVFRQISFPRFADYVCKRFLHENGNPFHRYVVHILLCYLYPEDREKVLHWLRRKEVHRDFLHKLGAIDEIDRSFKVVDVIKILISLFTRDVARNLPGKSDRPTGDRVFFFAFDQMEGRKELFDGKDDWFKFFAQLSELYNALPNVFIVFTMTLSMAKQLYPQMEKQFQDRILRDQRFWLKDVPASELLTLYHRRLNRWLGNDLSDLWAQIQEPAHRFLPFSPDEIVAIGKQKTLRETIDDLDIGFRKYLDEMNSCDPRLDYLVSRNELREEEQNDRPFEYTADHLTDVKALFDLQGDELAAAVGLGFGGTAERTTASGLRALQLEFHPIGESGPWTRVMLVRLPYGYRAHEDDCRALIGGPRLRYYSLWLVRPTRIDPELENLRPDQTYPRVLPEATHTSLRAMLRLLAKKNGYKPNEWTQAETLIREETKLTYLGEMLAQVRSLLTKLQTVDGSQTPNDAAIPVTELEPEEEAI